MVVTSEIVMDLQRPGAPSIVHAKQGERYTRKVKIRLYSGGATWEIPSVAEFWVCYRKPDGTGGKYAQIDDGNVYQAVSASGSVLEVMLAPQMLTCAGMVCCDVHMNPTPALDTEEDLSTFSFFIDVQASAESGITSEDYWNMASTDRLVLLSAEISTVKGTTQTFARSAFLPEPVVGDAVLGSNGYAATVSTTGSKYISTLALGQQWSTGGGSSAGGVPTSRTVNGKALSEDIVLSAEDVPVGKSNNVEAVLTSIQNELNYTVPASRKVNDKELSADITLGAGDIGVVTPTIPDGGYDRKKRYRSCDTVQKFIDEFLNSDLGKLIFLQADVPETADGIVACDDESLCFPRMPDEGEYVVGKNGYIGQAELDENGEYYDIVSTGWRLFDFGDATKKYVNEQVKYGYIDKTRDFASQGTYDDVQEYLMSLGEGRWMFNSSFEQHTEDMHCAYLVECVEFGSLKYWTVQEFLDDFSRSIRLYNNLSDDDTPVCVFEFYGDVGEEIGSFLPFPVATPTKNGHATTKKYVDDKFAALDYIDKTEEYNAKVTAEGVKAADLWLRTLTDGKYKVSNADEGELTLCDNFALSAVTRSATGRFCISRFYKYSGTVSIAIYFDGDELFRMFGDSGDAVSEGTFFDYVNERVPYCNTAGKVLTAKGDGSTEWTTPSGSVTLPEFTAADAGKVLKVKSDGTLYWGIDNDSSVIDGGSSGGITI